MTANNNQGKQRTAGWAGVIGTAALVGVLATAAITPALAVIGVTANSGFNFFENLPSYLEISALAQRSDIYATAADGSPVLLASFFDQNREDVPFNQISQSAKDAAIAGGDVRFYQHGGIDLQGTTRALISNILRKGKKDTQGGSSITQQYVKNVLVNNATRAAKTNEEFEKLFEEATAPSVERKLREVRYAIALNKKFSKNDILTGYLNISPFGGRVYGIEAAAKYYYGKNAKDLNAAEAASLIAILNSPTALRLDKPDSKTNGVETTVNGQVVPYAANKTRRDYILNQMYNLKMLTKAQYDEAIATVITPKITPPSTGCVTAGNAAYFCNYVSLIIRNQFDDPKTTDVNEGQDLLSRGGLKIFTSLDINLQNTSQEAIDANVPVTDPRFEAGSVAVTVQVGTGRVLAMAQNKRFSEDPEVTTNSPDYTSVNFSTDKDYGGSSGKQPGSTFKVFTLAEWLNAGHSLTESFNGLRRPFTTFKDSCNASGGASDGTWYAAQPFNPLNDDSTVAGNALSATKFSVNTAFVAMAQLLDLCNIKKTAQAFGIHRADGNPLVIGPADVLGTQEIAPLTMAAAYAGVANKGVFCTPIAIDKIIRYDGSEIAPPTSKCTEAVTPEVASAMTYALRNTFNGGTTSSSDPDDGIEHIGKTGTTDDAFATWMIGASTKVATAVWVGNIVGDQNLRQIYFPSGQAAYVRHHIWPLIMRAADTHYGGDDFGGVSPSFLKNTPLKIPAVVGLNAEAATKALTDAGFIAVYGGIVLNNSPAGTVASTDPVGQAPGATAVTFYISSGTGVNVPNVVGKPRAEAESALTTVGLKVSVQQVNTEDNNQNGIVLDQSPGSSIVEPGTTVKINVGKYIKAAEPAPTQPAPKPAPSPAP